MLRAVLRTSGLAGAGAVVLFLGLHAFGGPPGPFTWAMAVAIVLLAFLSLGLLVWSVLSLPPGAPWRRTALRGAACLLAATFGGAWLLGVGQASVPVGAALALTGGLLVKEEL